MSAFPRSSAMNISLRRIFYIRPCDLPGASVFSLPTVRDGVVEVCARAFRKRPLLRVDGCQSLLRRGPAAREVGEERTLRLADATSEGPDQHGPAYQYSDRRRSRRRDRAHQCADGAGSRKQAPPVVLGERVVPADSQDAVGRILTVRLSRADEESTEDAAVVRRRFGLPQSTGRQEGIRRRQHKNENDSRRRPSHPKDNAPRYMPQFNRHRFGEKDAQVYP